MVSRLGPGAVARAATAGALITWFLAQPKGGFTDFTIFYEAGHAIGSAGAPLYDTVQSHISPYFAFKLPPSAALYLMPLVVLSLTWAYRVWWVLSAAAYFGSFILLCRALDVRTLSGLWLVGLSAWSAFWPARFSIREGQWDAMILLCVTLAGLGAAAARPRLLALPLAAAGSTKLYPLAAGLFLLARRWWSGATVLTVATAALIGLGAVVAGPDESFRFVTHALPAAGEVTGYPDNQALGGVLARLVSADLRMQPVRIAPQFEWGMRLMSLGLEAGAMWLVWRAPPTDYIGRALQFALFIPLTVLAIPVAWFHYFTVLLAPFFIVAVDQKRRNPHGWWTWLFLAVAFALISFTDPGRLLIDRDVRHSLGDMSVLADASASEIARDAGARLFSSTLSRLPLSFNTLGALLLLGLLVRRVATSSPPCNQSSCSGSDRVGEDKAHAGSRPM